MSAKRVLRIGGCLGFLLIAGVQGLAAPSAASVQPVVEVEEDVYSYEPADNGAGPLWCSGSTCLVRAGKKLFASGLETIKDCPPLNNCRWTLFERVEKGWQLIQADTNDLTREPCPLAAFGDGRLLLSVNPTLRTNRQAGGGSAQPRVLQFPASDAKRYETQLPVWAGAPKFTEHSYRSFASDAPNNELILFQNIDYSHAEWTFLGREGHWSAQGRLVWPWGAEYDKPQPIRVCYPSVAIKDRAVHFCGVSDILEPYQKWREFKKQITGREWDYDFRRLFYTWTPDIRTGKFHEWIEIASRDKTCGWISPGDLWIGPSNTVHLLWMERALDERLRERFYPDAKQSHSLNYAVVRDGNVVLRRSLVEAEDGGEIPSAGRFHITPDNRLFVFCYIHGTDRNGQAVSENRVFQVLENGNTTAPVRVPLKTPFTATFTTTVRAGSPLSEHIELLGQQGGKPRTMSYARIRLN
jgi:hypothetical protein